MAYVTYIAKREIEPTGFSKTGTDLSAIGSDDSFNAGSGLSGLLTDQWLLAAGFVKNSGWFQIKSNSTSAKILTNTPPVTHLRLPGVGGNYASTPDSAAVSITGDIDLRVKVALNDWTPAADNELIAKWRPTGNQKSYLFFVLATGALRLIWTENGATDKTVTSTVSAGFADGSTNWVRVTLDVNNGAAGNDAKFWTSSDGAVWTQLGTTVTTAVATSIFDSTAVVEIGTAVDGIVGASTGRFYYAELRNGIDGPVVAAFDPSRGARGAGSLVAATGETWTINTSGTPPALLQGPLIQDEGAEYLSSGSGSGYSTSPDSAALSVIGSIELTAQAALTDWTPATVNGLVAKDDGATNRDYYLSIDTAGKPNFLYTTDGSTTAGRSAVSTIAVPFADGAIGWVKATYNSGTGTVQFFTSTDGVIFTQLGTNVAITSGAIHNGTGQASIGIRGDGANPFSGKIYYAEVRNGIGGPVVAAWNPGRAAAGAASFVAYTGESWSIQGTGALVRTTPVTITGYKRGLGQSYNLEFYTEKADRSVKVKRSSAQPIGGGAAEVLLNRQETFLDLTVVGPEGALITEAQMLQYREFLASHAAGEIFTIDRYGTVAAPVEPKQAQLSSEDYMEERIAGAGNLGLYKLSFQVRLLS